MFWYLIFALIFIFSTLILMPSFIGMPSIYEEESTNFINPHKYEDSTTSIADIKVFAFYFVPANKTSSVFSDWQNILEQSLEKVGEFHILQFQGHSRLTYKIFPEIVVGREENIVYDTNFTQHGNPKALKHIADEIEIRIFSPSGDLYNNNFSEINSPKYPVILIMYEGVGASGGGNVALVSRVFFTSSEYAENKESLLAHEFYHTLGIPDGYNIETAVPHSQDIMGIGRSRSIYKTYISREVLKKMGLYR